MEQRGRGGEKDQREEDNELRRAVQYAVLEICNDTMTKEEDTNIQMTQQAIAAISELTYLYAVTSLARDLDCFSDHANRRTITVDDVKLVARKNNSLLQKLQDFCDTNDSTTASNEKVNRRVSGTTNAKKRKSSNSSNFLRRRSSLQDASLEDSSSSSDAMDVDFVVAGRKQAAATPNRKLPIDVESNSSDSSDDNKNKKVVCAPLRELQDTDDDSSCSSDSRPTSRRIVKKVENKSPLPRRNMINMNSNTKLQKITSSKDKNDSDNDNLLPPKQSQVRRVLSEMPADSASSDCSEL